MHLEVGTQGYFGTRHVQVHTVAVESKVSLEMCVAQMCGKREPHIELPWVGHSEAGQPLSLFLPPMIQSSDVTHDLPASTGCISAAINLP